MSEIQRTVDRVNDALPVSMSIHEASQNPEFMNLLVQLGQHITPDGTNIDLQRDIDEAESALKKEKSHWLEQHVLYAELQELLLDSKIKAVQGSPSAAGTTQFYKAVSEMLTMTEIGDYLNCHPDPSCDLTLLGLSRKDINRRNPHKKHVQSIQQKLIPEIESHLRKRCENLVSFHDNCQPARSNGQTESAKLTFAKASQLPLVIEAEQSEITEQKKQLKRDKANRDKQLTLYLQTLMESLETLEKLITKHRLRSQPENDRISSEWLAARCDAMCLKIKTLELQLMCDTYYSDTVQALCTIRGHLDKAIQDTEGELRKASEALKAYEAVGMGFNKLVEEYTHLQSEVDNKKWAIREMKELDTPGEESFLLK